MSATADKEVMALAIQIKGEIVDSNFDAFKAHCLEQINGMKYELLTDDDFTKAKEDIKNLQTTEKALKQAEEEALKQMGDVYSLIDGIREIQKASASCRLDKSREVKKRDAEIKTKIIEDALAKIDHDSREKFRQLVTDGVKGKRSFKTMAQGADKSATGINESIIKTREVIEVFSNEHGKTLIPDARQLELQDSEGVANELRHRLEKQRDEAEKARLKAQLDAEEERQRVAEKVEQDKKERKAKESEDVNKESSTTTQNLSNGNDSTSLRQDEGDLRQPSKSGNHFDKRPSEPVAGISADEEWEQFVNTVPSVFLQFRELRLGLKNAKNQAKALKMAESVNAAYLEMKGDRL